jgi:hypothetical protein
MKRKTLTHLLVWGITFLLLPATAIPQQAIPPPSSYTTEPEIKKNIGTIRDNMCQIYDKICLEKLENKKISPEQYDELMRMMNQMGGIMQEMSRQSYNQTLELYHRQQLEQIHRNLNGMQ